MLRRWLPVAALFALLFWAYSPLWNAPFLSWDDDANILNNPYFAGLSPWWNLWRHAYYGMYVPVSSTLWYALFSMGGGDPLYFRIANFILHLGNTILVYVLIRKVVNPQSRAVGLIGAAVFALHPLQAGAVAWISGGRDLLSLSFSLVATLVFFSGQTKLRQVTALLFFIAALLAKPQASILPLALLVYAAFFDDRHWLRVGLRLLPWFAASFGAALITYLAQTDVMEWSTPLWQRPLIIFDSYGFYLSKLLWPVALTADYGRTPAAIFADREILIAHIAVSLSALVVIKVLKPDKWKIAYLWFVLLLPTSGLVDFGFQYISTVADHYAYPAMVIVALLVATAIEHLLKTLPRLQTLSAQRVLAFIATTIALLLTWQTYRHAGVWADEQTFFQNMLALNPSSYAGNVALGTLDCIRGQQTERGLNYLNRAREIRPDDPTATADVANCLFRLGRHADVLKIEQELATRPKLRERLKTNDRSAAALFVPIGASYFQRGELETALEYFCQAVWRDPLEKGFQDNIQVTRQGLAQRGLSRDCPGRADLDEFVKRRLTPSNAL